MAPPHNQRLKRYSLLIPFAFLSMSDVATAFPPEADCIHSHHASGDRGCFTLFLIILRRSSKNWGYMNLLHMQCYRHRLRSCRKVPLLQ